LKKSCFQPVEKNSSLCFIFNKAHIIAHNILLFVLQDEQRQRRTGQSRKFKSTQNVYNVSIKDLPENNPTFVRCLFRDVIKNVKQQMQTSPMTTFNTHV
jgi:hypothetical protein